ncbi:hypothetical protein GLOTRDRAFT_133902 [Gloeophyllum trabeum ATCC 11539]|uniref:non-specific serine/threonine protein kinase n=1 Tax=Gloeophyllum trabeum (strain ATCC 11539 / FP-39264 / Madison 617) TaxID=670483 RepID=S7R885_GLOTA|nr:uncharacterized protein GLOTRDRAFT_133902 [Gloeophyllum trabeum ATCC 11539]EPQ50535.1 hypothetical protein GLOTRDRAFT_133902 [Gloeophyllum trabeum ATCC 11539]
MTVRPEAHRDVAIKTIKRSGLNQKLLDYLQSEIDIVKGTPRHITKLIDIINAEHNIFLIMEYCAGDDLKNYMRKRGRVEGLECIRGPGMPPQYYPYPRTCGLDGIVVRSFLRQLELTRRLLKREVIERCNFEEFFGSTALAKSKFPRPSKTRSSLSSVHTRRTQSDEPWPSEETVQPTSTAEADRQIPVEVLDPKVFFPPKISGLRRNPLPAQKRRSQSAAFASG